MDWDFHASWETHTPSQTADEQILRPGTAPYQSTDVGMTGRGIRSSVWEIEAAIERFPAWKTGRF